MKNKHRRKSEKGLEDTENTEDSTGYELIHITVVIISSYRFSVCTEFYSRVCLFLKGNPYLYSESWSSFVNLSRGGQNSENCMQTQSPLIFIFSYEVMAFNIYRQLKDNGSYHELREPIRKLENHYPELKI